MYAIFAHIFLLAYREQDFIGNLFLFNFVIIFCFIDCCKHIFMGLGRR